MGRLIFTKRASSSTPEVGKVALYAKNDGKLYIKKEDGTESEVGSGGGGGGEPVDYPITLDKGGTGATTAQGALNALTNVAAASAGYVLTKVGSNVAWAAASNGSGSEAGLPNPAGSNANDVVVSNGNAQYTLVDDTTFVSAAGAVMKSSFPAKGSLVAGAGVGTVGFLQAGATGQVLTANPATASGLQWQDRVTMITGTANTVPRITGQGIITASGITITAADAFIVPATGNLVSNGPVFANAGLTVQGNVTVSGTVDGRDVSVDGAKLDGIKKDNTTATTDPGASNNTSQGYSVGSRWINTSTDPAKQFVCTFATSNAASWREVSSSVFGAISKAELQQKGGTDITPAGATNDLVIGPQGDHYRTLQIGGSSRSFISLDPTKPPGFNTPMNAVAAVVNPYARYVRMKSARGLFVGNNPVTVCAFSKQISAVNLPAAGADVRLVKVAELGSLPFQTGVLDLDLQLRGSHNVPISLNQDTIPQFRWWLAISKNSGTSPTLKISDTDIVADAGYIAAAGIVYSPKRYPTSYNEVNADDTHFHWRISVDLRFTTSNNLPAWISSPTGTVVASNRNEDLGEFGAAKMFGLSETSHIMTSSNIANPNEDGYGFATADQPRVALYISQSGAVGVDKHMVGYYGRARDGVTILAGHCTGYFTPRLVDLAGDIATKQYRKADGTFADY